VLAFEIVHQVSDPLSDGDASGVHADENETTGAAVALQNFVGDARKGASHLFVCENLSGACSGPLNF
jgi:hypothetical protein